MVCLQADNPERVMKELEATDVPFDSWYGTQMRKAFGFDVARLPLAASGELLFAWRDDDARDEREASKSHEPEPLLAKEGICGTCREGWKRWATRARQAPSRGCLPSAAR